MSNGICDADRALEMAKGREKVGLSKPSCRPTRMDQRLFGMDTLPEGDQHLYPNPPESSEVYDYNPYSLCEGEAKDPRYKGEIGFIPFAFHLVPLFALAKVSAVMRKGDLKGRGDGWKYVPKEEHLNHALAHIYAYLSGRGREHHLANAGCRILMALDMDRDEIDPSIVVGAP